MDSDKTGIGFRDNPVIPIQGIVHSHSAALPAATEWSWTLRTYEKAEPSVDHQQALAAILGQWMIALRRLGNNKD